MVRSRSSALSIASSISGPSFLSLGRCLRDPVLFFSGGVNIATRQAQERATALRHLLRISHCGTTSQISNEVAKMQRQEQVVEQDKSLIIQSLGLEYRVLRGETGDFVRDA